MLHKSIVVDLDGTVVNTYGQRFCNIASKVAGERIKPSDLTEYNFAAITPLTESNLVDIFGREGFYKYLRPLPGSVEGLRRLHTNGFELHFMTVRPSNDAVRAETLQWFVKHKVPFNSVQILSHAEGGAGKARVAKALNFSYFVEDNPNYTAELAKVCARGFLINNRYTANVEPASNVTKIDNLLDMAKILLA
jgi:uncharacterized HAD superfamily protein